MPDLPRELAFGWNPTLHTTTDHQSIAALPPHQALVTESPAPYEFAWTLAKISNKGNHLPDTIQRSTDCVAAGCATIGKYLAAIELAPFTKNWCHIPWHIPWIYGKARVQIGGGNLHGPGATGYWGARVITELGHTRSTDFAMPPYTKQLSDDWGERPGPPSDWDGIAAARKIHRLERCQSVNQVRSALLTGRLLTIASQRGFRLEPQTINGYNCFTPSGSWSHQMSLIAWIDEPIRAAYRLNTWGPQYHGPQLHDEPPGGAWCTEDVLAEELDWPDTECYAYSLLEHE